MTDEPPRTRRCRIAFLGCGRATTELHLPALRRVPDIEVVGLCDTDVQAARRAASEFGVVHATTHRDALLARTDIDAVAVCVPPEHHADAAIAVLDAGHHLFLEKPVAHAPEACDRVAERAARSDRHVVVGFNLRQHRLLRAARERMAEIGRIDLIRSTFTSDIALRRPLPPWRRSREQGGGVLFELGVHHFDLWRFLTGLEFVEVFAYRSGEGAHDRAATLLARSADGAMATAQLDEATRAANALEILGDGGAIDISLYEFDGLRITAADTPPGGIGARIRGLRDTVSALPDAVAEARSGGGYLSTFAEEWRRFADTILRNAPPAASLADGLAATRMSIAAAESVRTGRAVAV